MKSGGKDSTCYIPGAMCFWKQRRFSSHFFPKCQSLQDYTKLSYCVKPLATIKREMDAADKCWVLEEEIVRWSEERGREKRSGLCQFVDGGD